MVIMQVIMQSLTKILMRLGLRISTHLLFGFVLYILAFVRELDPQMNTLLLIICF